MNRNRAGRFGTASDNPPALEFRLDRLGLQIEKSCSLIMKERSSFNSPTLIEPLARLW